MTGTRTPARAQFLADVLTTAVEGGVAYWATVTAYHWENLDPAEYFVDLYETEDAIDVPDADIEIHHVTIDTIAKGIGILVKDNAALTGYWRQFLLANRTNGDDGDYDAEIADSILQAGVLGSVVYG